MIVKLHGNSGSGKTTVARQIMKMATKVVPLGDPKRPEAYQCGIKGLDRPLYVLGPYTNTCGGLDSIGTWRESADLLHKYALLGHVFYEGLLASTYYGSFGIETERYGKNHIFAFMDTPLEMCIENIKARRLAAGNKKPLKEDNTRNRVTPILGVKRRCKVMNRIMCDISHTNATAEVIDLFK